MTPVAQEDALAGRWVVTHQTDVGAEMLWPLHSDLNTIACSKIPRYNGVHPCDEVHL